MNLHTCIKFYFNNMAVISGVAAMVGSIFGAGLWGYFVSVRDIKDWEKWFILPLAGAAFFALAIPLTPIIVILVPLVVPYAIGYALGKRQSRVRKVKEEIQRAL